MHNVLRTLDRSHVVLDLGCGLGSFNYATYNCRIIGIDVYLSPSALYRDGSRVQYLKSDAKAIPLTDSSVDAVLCHHSLEHFPDYLRTLGEVARVLKSTGALWIAVPNGYSFDDALYRFTDAGHSHVNRFNFDRLLNEVQRRTGLQLLQSISLFSGFVYLKQPLPGMPSLFGRLLGFLPSRLNRSVVVLVNAVTRMLDRLLGTQFSQYGWGFVFARHKIELELLPSYFNVCWKCGSGHGAEYLRGLGRVKSFLFMRLFCCPDCQANSFFFEPPRGLQ